MSTISRGSQRLPTQLDADTLNLRIRKATATEESADEVLCGLSRDLARWKDRDYATGGRVYNVYIPCWIVGNKDRVVYLGINLKSESSKTLNMYQLTTTEAYAYLSSAEDATGDVVLLRPGAVKDILEQAVTARFDGALEQHRSMSECRKALTSEFQRLEGEGI